MNPVPPPPGEPAGAGVLPTQHWMVIGRSGLEAAGSVPSAVLEVESVQGGTPVSAGIAAQTLELLHLIQP